MSGHVEQTSLDTGALDARVTVGRGTFTLDAEVYVAPGEILGVIGANGAGKSTLLGALAGTLPLRSGQITLGDRVLSRTDAATPAVSVPRAARRVGYLDQRARLFPHLDAAANVAFGPRAQGRGRRAADTIAREWLARVGLGDRGSARAEALSGGQQQRVAIGRTLAADPALLLLDEPFAAVDVASSVDLRHLVASEVRRLGVPTILVTHDPVDLIALADRVLVLEDGVIGQLGSVADVLGAPSSPFAAEFAGRALIRGRASDHGTIHLNGAPVSEVSGTGQLPRPGAAAVGSFDPAAVRLTSPAATSTAASNAAIAAEWLGTVSAVFASRTGVRITCTEWPEFVAEIPVSRAVHQHIAVGDRVGLSLAQSDLTFAVPRAPAHP
ncbi:hypothetical protein GCM10009847_16050 [Leucobacter tardus]|uniref:ATP-binding cassette domain-containing protein n=1 Tax=Leucobacter tardus TaxID=501483 RepID=A0A939QND2_9MICO|nr:ATP-binding cassette domain-containing protein [Leucobacter tardus]MBO2990879.1 ATP-binding cassette domain-containing protein [Leucobacter tardus]